MTLGKDGVTTGASNDIQRATHIARSMATKWGLSEKLGPLLYDEDEGEVFLGKNYGSGGSRMNVSGETARLIDEEVRRVIDECYNRAHQILVDNRDKLDVMADALIQYETIDSDQIDDIMAGREVRPPKDSGDSGNDSAKPPVEPQAKAPEDDAKKSDSSIGGPAGEH